METTEYSWSPPAPSRATRSIPKKSQGHFVTEFTFGEGRGQRLGNESLLEHKIALCAIYRPGVVDIREQVEPVVYRDRRGATRTHHFDYLVTIRAGSRIAIAVKPSCRVDAAFRDTMGLIAAAAIPTLADKVVIATERNFSLDDFENAKIFHAARIPQPGPDSTLAAFAARIVDEISVGEILKRTGLLSDGFFGVARLIRTGVLTMVGRDTLSWSTIVAPGAAS